MTSGSRRPVPRRRSRASEAATGTRLASRRTDRATRDRLLDTARRLFVERGFQRVGVREITETAQANIAAVSYHFRDKLGLYRAVIEDAVAHAREAFQTAQPPAGTSPEERLRAFVRANLQRMASDDARAQVIPALMRHEMMNPTPALPFLIEKASLPRMRYLAEIVSELLHRPPADPVVGLCVTSIHAQFILHMKHALRDQFFADWRLHTFSPERVADHIVAFTLGGLRQAAAVGGDA